MALDSSSLYSTEKTFNPTENPTLAFFLLRGYSKAEEDDQNIFKVANLDPSEKRTGTPCSVLKEERPHHQGAVEAASAVKNT